MKIFIKIISLIFILGGLIATAYFLWQLSFDYKIPNEGSVLLDKTGQVGDFIGGVIGTIFTLAGFLVLVLTLLEQTSFASKERFESKFFELLKLHRENVKELEADNLSGRKEYHNIFMQFLNCREDLKPVFSRQNINHIYEPEFLNNIESKLKLTHPSIDLFELAKLNIAYLITYYGVSSDGKTILHNTFEGKYKKTFTNRVIEFIAMKPVEESKYFKKWVSVMKMNRHKKKVKTFELIRRLRNNENIDTIADSELVNKATAELYQSNYTKFYGGHQYKLGHYFRHLFQTFSFINLQTILSDKEKYFYAKTLRAQLSTHEQALLFVNSISFLGLKWDLIPDIKKRRLKIFKRLDPGESRLITKYNLIKNIPGEEIFGIKYNQYYPEVEYERFNI